MTFFACVLLSACHKTDTSANREVITGKWEIRQRIGGINGTIIYAPGTMAILFDGNGHFEYTYGINVDGIPREGPYRLEQYSNSSDWKLLLQYMSNGQIITENDSVRFDGNKLLFLPAAACCDIPTTIYKRLALTGRLPFLSL